MAAKNSIEYRPVPGFPNYKIGSDGSVWKLKKKKWIKPAISTNSKGYKKIALRADPVYVLIHRLVLETFVGHCPDGKQACHKNGKRFDNQLKNLRWNTQSNNEYDKINHGTSKRKLTREQASKIKKDVATHGRGIIKSISLQLGISHGLIYHILKGLTYKDAV